MGVNGSFRRRPLTLHYRPDKVERNVPIALKTSPMRTSGSTK
jgi:hypothetical protein